MAIIAHLTEISITIAFLVACVNAAAQDDGRRHLATVLWGAVAGLLVEIALVTYGEGYHYEYWRFWGHVRGVPIFIGLGWGTIFYITTWTAERLRLRNFAETAFVAGILAVNLDLSIDPTATMNKYWVWDGVSFDHGFFGVPFDNFISWVAIIATYSTFTKVVFGGWNKWPWLSAHRALRDIIAPPIGALLGGGIFAVVRLKADAVYYWIGAFVGRELDGSSSNMTSANSLGQATIFIVLFIVGLVIFSRNVLRAARDQPVNLVVLGLASFLHALSVLLFLSGVVKMRGEAVTFTAIAVMIPINAILGFLAFAWPSIDRLFKDGRSDQKRVLFNEVSLSSYSGDRIRALVATPTSTQEMRAVLAYAKQNDSKITFRGGGYAFDTQSLNADLVVLLGQLKTITLAPDANTVTVQCGATWGEILRTTLPAGRVPHVMITTGGATAGGTLSANSLSRFSAFYGREGKHVESFQIVTPEGQLLTCSRDENAELFGAVIGGLGYVGAVVECTYRLRAVHANARVRSDFQIYSGIPSIAKAIEVHSLELAQELKSRKLARKPEPEHEGNALSAAMYLRGGIRGLVASSTYVSSDTPLQPCPFHTPGSAVHRLLQFFAMIPVLRHLGFFFTYNFAFRGKMKTFVDEAHGYSFFEDGNVRVRSFLKGLGLPVPILQQTFIIPDGADDEPKLRAFFGQAAKLFADQRVEPALVDLLYVPADDDDFLLSSSHGMAGFAVTYTFESLFRPLTRERAALRALSEACAHLDGRVHLVKNVCADSAAIKKMYAGRIQRMKAVRERVGGTNVHNDFASRILDGI
jgi:decaprenylphospho-beta-D-ribofuranose 2-oxidase